MIKTYRKTATVQAEQFDGSGDMMTKYDIRPRTINYLEGIFGGYYIPTLEGNLEFKKGDWIATGVDGEHYAIADDIFKKTYEEVEE
ncbi:hypothetical protein [Lactobacillus terrae]|uniref:hypothetical protein n=1 Tax=Lactobacillus terrae TaxID=2269374 RepID=UPI000C1B7D15|nr:hypothetical protein [Lactobacillus terrae]